MLPHMSSVVALAGGVGGAKLADGLSRALGDRLTLIVNTGDDFEHLGFHISPDLDTVMYTLGGIANPEQGWGLAGETWNFMDQIGRLGGPDWFRLGDRDIATHVLRTERLRRGERLSLITADLCRALGVKSTVLPMTDDAVRTMVHSGSKTLAFQEYFVRLRAAVSVSALSFDGAEGARPAEEIAPALANADLSVIIMCPSNPYLSIDPILAVPGLRQALLDAAVPIVAVSPIVGGAALKGPAAKIMQELGVEPSVVSIARHYRGLATGLVVDEVDAAHATAIEAEGMRVCVTQSVMRSAEDRLQLAQETLRFARELDAREQT
jgi:LPPG:FO 2-phospho-L-lactate transferase